MEALELLWRIGQALSVAILCAGAVLTVVNSEVFSGDGAKGRDRAAVTPHEPMNHRLLLEAEW